jgi:isopentenyldiphosphate isomerase
MIPIGIRSGRGDAMTPDTETEVKNEEDPAEELLNVYDAAGNVIGARPRREAKASGLAVGAVNALVVNGRREVLLQRRPASKENGGRWDKTVGGHVSAGEDFGAALLREAGEELFDDGASPRVKLASSDDEFARALGRADLSREVVLRRVGFQRNLRDVRHVPGGGLRNVLYHVAIYVGRTEVPCRAFRPQPSEIDELRYFAPAQLDRMLVGGELSPNMAFLWLTHAYALVGLVGEAEHGGR